MGTRPFRFQLSATAHLPTQTYVFFGSSLWLLQETSLLALAPEIGTEVCQAMTARVGRTRLEWKGLQGRHHVEVIRSGSYLMTVGRLGLMMGTQHEGSPAQWLSRMISINGEDAIVSALKGTYLTGEPWEEVSSVLEEVREKVLLLLAVENPDWDAIEKYSKRFAEGGFMDNEEVQQFLESVQKKSPSVVPFLLS